MVEAAYVTTRARAQVEVPRGASSTLDPQIGEAWQQVQLSESFVLEDMSSTPPPTLQKGREGTTSCKTSTKLEFQLLLQLFVKILCFLLKWLQGHVDLM